MDVSNILHYLENSYYSDRNWHKNFSRTGIEPVTDGWLRGRMPNYSPPLYQLSYRETGNTLDEDRTHDLGFIRPTL